MKLSTKSRYAIRSMIEVANANRVISVVEVSQNQDISERYLELIFSILMHAGLIKSARGSHGGYMMAKDPKDITVYDIMKATEIDINIIRRKQKDDAMGKVLNDNIWQPVNQNLIQYLKSITLDSLLN